MSWTVNGITWTPQSASTHATTQLNYLNSLNVAPSLTASPTNAIWLEFLGSGSIQQTYDDKLYAASQSFSLATCDDTQLLSLAPITGTSPIAATYSTVYLNVTAAAAGNATVTGGSSKVAFGSINFVVAATTTIPAGTTVSVFAVADTPGPYLALAGQLTSFTASITNVQTVTNPANSTQGSNTETNASFRQRLISGAGTINWDLDGAILSVRALQGVISANIYFNKDTVTTLTTPPGISVLPRHAYIVIQGSDVTGGLPNAYQSRMTAPTDGGSSGNWISLSGQAIPVYYDIATNQNVWVNLYYDPSQPSSSNWLALAAAIIVALNSTLTIGQPINSADILQALTGFTYATISGATLSLDGVTYTRSVQPNGNKVPTFATAIVGQVTGP